MTVTKVSKSTRGRYLVYIDDRPFCPLYGAELSTYHVEPGAEITEETCETIKQEVLIKRSRLRAMNLLMKHGFTESGLRTKLAEGGYPADVVDDAVEYVKGFGYVDDKAFARDYVFSHASDKSVRRIVSDLLSKGVSQDVINEILEENRGTSDAVDEEAQIRKLLIKRSFDPARADARELSRTYAYLSGRGFGMDVIRKVMSGFGGIEFYE